jgi:anthranilate phosphoribosyltransferase
LSLAALLGWWQAVTDFDPVLAEQAADPVAVPARTVIVAGSGKEVFKTFNVSTAAAILAAAAGTPIVKGVSRSVSAVSGAADILEALGIAAVGSSAQIAQALDVHGIAFVPYPVFCPLYAARYDGVFDAINPASFFMPVAALCVTASGFVFGLGHPDVELSARALHLVRGDLAGGVVVSTDLSNGETIDEYGNAGTVVMARKSGGAIAVSMTTNPPPTVEWRRSVAHRKTHAENAALLVQGLAADQDTPCTRLIEQNAALVVASGGCSMPEAHDRVRHARESGRAARLLNALKNA